jgi:hypothetical protein
LLNNFAELKKKHIFAARFGNDNTSIRGGTKKLIEMMEDKV